MQSTLRRPAAQHAREHERTVERGRRRLHLGELEPVDVAVVGGGIAGMATAARLQARGRSTVVLEAHGLPGGCAGYFRRRGFSFDVGATTLVDFDEGGVGGALLGEIGMSPPPAEQLPGYLAWLPDRKVTLHRDPGAWHAERLDKLGDTDRHRRLWQTLDDIARVYWRASRRGAVLPMQRPGDVVRNLQALGVTNIPSLRFLGRTLGDLLRAFGLREDRVLVGLLSMLVEDTVHATIDEAPLVNAALGITIRGAGLTRTRGGMRGFWDRFAAHYRELGGRLVLGCRAQQISGRAGAFTVVTNRGTLRARQVVCAIPPAAVLPIAPRRVAQGLAPYVVRDLPRAGGALVVFLGVPEREVAGQAMTHHQLLQSYDAPLGNGNNMFVSVSAPGDLDSAPADHRAVMVSTHCELEPWMRRDDARYPAHKEWMTENLLYYARRVYPRLGRDAAVCELGTPRTYARFALRPGGAVGGVRQTLRNANQRAVPHRTALRGFHLVGDGTWPGLGTVACVVGSRIVAERVHHSLGAGLRRALQPRES